MPKGIGLNFRLTEREMCNIERKKGVLWLFQSECQDVCTSGFEFDALVHGVIFVVLKDACWF